MNKFHTLVLKETRTKRNKIAVEGFAQTEEFEYLFSSLKINRKPLVSENLYKRKKKLNFTLDCLPSIFCIMFLNMFLRLLHTSPRI